MLQLFMLEVKTCAMQFWAWQNEGDCGLMPEGSNCYLAVACKQEHFCVLSLCKIFLLITWISMLFHYKLQPSVGKSMQSWSTENLTGKCCWLTHTHAICEKYKMKYAQGSSWVKSYSSCCISRLLRQKCASPEKAAWVLRGYMWVQMS